MSADTGPAIPSGQPPGAATSGLGAIAKRVAANTGAQMVSNVVGKLAVLVMFAVIARSLGAVSVGELTFAVSIGIIVQIGGLGTDPLIARQAAQDRGSIKGLFWNALGLKVVTGLLATLVVVAIAVLGDFDADVRVMLVLVTISGLIDLIAATPAWVLRGLDLMVPVATSALAQRLTTSILAVAAILIFDGGVVLVGVSFVIGALVGAAMLVRQLYRRQLWPELVFSFGKAKSIAIESLPLGASAALSTALARLDALLLTALSTLAVVGIYGAAYRLIEATFFIGYAFGTALFPMLSNLSADTRPTLGRVFEIGTRISLAGMLPVGALFILFPAPVIELVYGSGFAAAIEPTRWLGAVAAVNGLAAMALFALAARDMRTTILRVCASALFVNLVLNFALIPAYGATGAAIAMAAANLVLAIAGTRAAAREIGPLSAIRIVALTVIAFGAMALARVLMGETWPGLLVGLAAYVAALIVGHHQLFDRDTALVRRWLLSRGQAPER